MADIIKINVGGSIYTTSRSTLTNYPDSMLGAMFSGRMETTKDKEGNYWIDANGQMFRYVLDFLRRRSLVLPDGFKDYDLLEAEAGFYQLQELIGAVQSKHQKPVPENFVIETEFNAGDDTLISLKVFGPDDKLEQLHTVFTENFHMYNFSVEKFKYVDSYWIEKGITLSRVMHSIRSMGFRLDDVPEYKKNPNQTHMWFIRD